MNRIGALTLCLGLLFPQVSSSQIRYKVDKEEGIIITNIPAPSQLRGKWRIKEKPIETTPYDEIISKAADKYNLHPDLIKAVIEAESGYNPNAVSPKGAMGLMQLMPETAAKLNVSDPFDPEQNIEGGTRYLREMLDSFECVTELALAAYNAGPARVLWYGDIPPFQETQHYVNQVMKKYDNQRKSEGEGKGGEKKKEEKAKPLKKKTRIYLLSDGQGNIILTNIPVK